jgi:NADPH:quinone reductase-like Zn-dependent oxidoreductase
LLHGTYRAAASRGLAAIVRHRPCTLDTNVIGASDLATLKRLVEARQVTPIVSAHFSLAEVPSALSHFARNHARGKVAITV